MSNLNIHKSLQEVFFAACDTFIKGKHSKSKIPKYQYLTIPDAPNYEINGYFKVRNKITGRKKKSKQRIDRKAVVVSLRNNGKEVKRDVQTFYRQAVAALLDDGTWAPVYSLKNLYELSQDGELRNSLTKKLIKPIIEGNCIYYSLSVDGVQVKRTRNSLLNEVFATNFKRKNRPIRVILRKDGLAYHFESITAASKWLYRKVFIVPDFIRKKLNKRLEEVYGYQVSYF